MYKALIHFWILATDMFMDREGVISTFQYYPKWKTSLSALKIAEYVPFSQEYRPQDIPRSFSIVNMNSDVYRRLKSNCIGKWRRIFVSQIIFFPFIDRVVDNYCGRTDFRVDTGHGRSNSRFPHKLDDFPARTPDSSPSSPSRKPPQERGHTARALASNASNKKRSLAAPWTRDRAAAHSSPANFPTSWPTSAKISLPRARARQLVDE